MKIIQVLNHFLPQQTAGTEVYTWALSKELMKNGAEVKVLIPNYGKNQDESYVYDGITVHEFAEPSLVDRAIIMGFREADGLQNFKAYLEQEKPDIVHFHELAGSNGIGLPHVRAAKKQGAKIIMTFHLAKYTCQTGTLMYKGKLSCDGKISNFKCSTCYLDKKGLKNSAILLSGISNVLYRMNIDLTKLNHPIGTLLGTCNIVDRLERKLIELVNLCDNVVCITNWYQKVLLLNGINEDKITYIGTGLPYSHPYSSLSNEKGHAIKLMFLGRISQVKGLHLLIEALELFSDSEFELSIYGSSDGTNYEHNLKEKTKGKSNIHWKGSLRQIQVNEEMQKHDLLCLCSTVCEMSPLVIQEARASGLPVLVSNVYGNKEQLEQGATGLMFEMNDITSLQQKLFELIKNPNLLKEMKSNIHHPRSFRNVAIEYLNLYEKICEKARISN